MARNRNTRTDGGAFSAGTVEAVWSKAKPVSGKPGTAKDTCGATMERSQYGKTLSHGWEIDHIKPVSQGGKDDLANLQPLQWENNRHKGDNYPNWSCKITS